MSEEEPESSFLNRWSTRKRDAATPTINRGEDTASVSSTFPMPLETELSAAALIDASAVDTSVNLDDAEALNAAGASVAVSRDADVEELVLTDADMPAIESLTAESNVSPFFNKGVSAALRKAALRYVFQQPKFNVRDGLNDYDGDYTVFEPLGDTITSDMKFHAARKERDRLAAEAEREEELLRQEQLEADEASNDAEPVEKAETDEDRASEDRLEADDEPSLENEEAVDDGPSSETDEGTESGTGAGEESPPATHAEHRPVYEPTTLALADSDDEISQRTSRSTSTTEQV